MILTLRMPQATKADVRNSSSSMVRTSRRGEKRDLAGHAIAAAQIAPIGDRHSEVGDRSAEIVNESGLHIYPPLFSGTLSLRGGTEPQRSSENGRKP